MESNEYAPLIRVIPELRATHVEREKTMCVGTILYFHDKYDLGATEIPPNFLKVSLLSACTHLLRSRARSLELPEPLWLKYFLPTAILGSVWRVRGLLSRRKQSAAAYAIENNSVAAVIRGNRPLPGWVIRGGATVVGAVARGVLDKIAFGSPGSQRTYVSLPFVAAIERRCILELPSPDTTFENREGERGKAVFLGRLESRKGIELLLKAWPEVERRMPGASLAIIGDGPLERLVVEWCREKPESREFAGMLPHDEAKEVMSRASVLVAPSRREGRWREQIGLPISEALSAGMTIVSTRETGLGDWLSEHGHRVVTGEQHELSEAVLQALADPLPRDKVITALPQVPGRTQADRWMHQC